MIALTDLHRLDVVMDEGRRMARALLAQEGRRAVHSAYGTLPIGPAEISSMKLFIWEVLRLIVPVSRRSGADASKLLGPRGNGVRPSKGPGAQQSARRRRELSPSSG